MSDLLRSPWDDEEDPEDSRRRAMKGLIVLAAVAGLVVALVILIVAISGGGHHNQRLADSNLTALPTEPATETPSSPSTRPSTSPSASTSTSTSPTTPKPTSTANPCPSAAPCAVTGDAGGAVAAVNAFRVSHGRPAVPGTVSVMAQQCALQQGSGPNCEPHYAWQAVPTQDGQKVISMLAGRSAQWLLDPGIQSFSVGWAYAPGSGYECAILKID